MRLPAKIGYGFHIQRACLFVICSLIVMTSTSGQDLSRNTHLTSSQAQPPETFGGRPDGGRENTGADFRRNRGYLGWNSGRVRGPSTVESGWLFFNGKYIEPPYRITSDAGQVTVNGLLLEEAKHQPSPQSSDEAGDFRAQRPRGSRRSRDDDPHLLETGGFVVLKWAGLPTILLPESEQGIELLGLLIKQSESASTAATLLVHVPEDSRETFSNWLANYVLPPEVAELAKETIQKYQNAERANQRQHASVRRGETFNYLLSVLGMLLCTAAFGHLLRSHPPTEVSQPSLQDRRLVYRSLTLVIAFSALDLVWTLMGLDSGLIRETNPWARGLVESPVALTAYKITLTLFAVGVISALWKRRIAQEASWWACLILTLLTARWLTLNAVVA